MTPTQLLELAQSGEAEFVDLRCCDLLTGCQHFTLPLDEPRLVRIGRGAPLEVPGLDPARRLRPAPETAFLDPFCQHATLALYGDLVDAATGRDDVGDARGVARRTEARLAASDVRVQAALAVELEFFVFDQASFEQGLNAARCQVDAREGSWRRGREEPDNLGTQIAPGAGAGRLPPADSLHNLRGEMAAALAACGVPCAGHWRGPATGGHAALALGPAGLVQAADAVTTCKYIVRNVAARHGKVATFMPQPLCGERGSGLSVRLTLLRDGRPLLAGAGPGGPPESTGWAIGGLLAHAPSLLALTCPTTNSYRRLVPAGGGPTVVAYGRQPGPAVVRVPLAAAEPDADWLEFRGADPSCNPHVALSAIVLAALDGLAQRRDPGPAVEGPLDRLAPGELARLRHLPGSLEEALRALEADQAYLLSGDAFPEALLADYVAHKRAREIAALRERPHPYEFCLYFDA